MAIPKKVHPKDNDHLETAIVFLKNVAGET
jgi:hypothetical protein